MSRKKTHGMMSNTHSMWMSEFREEIGASLEAMLKRLGVVREGRSTEQFLVVYRLEPDEDQWADPAPAEFIQAGGAADRMTVEVRRKVAGGFRVVKLGRPAAAGEAAESEAIVVVDPEHPMLVRPSEVLDWREACELFEYYYDHHAVAPGWHEREIMAFDETGMEVPLVDPSAGVTAVQPASGEVPTVVDAATVADKAHTETEGEQAAQEGRTGQSGR